MGSAHLIYIPLTILVGVIAGMILGRKVALSEREEAIGRALDRAKRLSALSTQPQKSEGENLGHE